VIDFHHFFIAYFLSNPNRSARIGGLRAAQAKLPTKFSTDRVDGRKTGKSVLARAATQDAAGGGRGRRASRRVSNIFNPSQRFRGIEARLLKP
jgi:hypothetical protein